MIRRANPSSIEPLCSEAASAIAAACVLMLTRRIPGHHCADGVPDTTRWPMCGP